MDNLATFIQCAHANSLKAYGQQRSIAAAAEDVSRALRAANGNPQELAGWVDVIMAAIEAAPRSGSSPFAVATALTAKQAELGARKWPPQLAMMAK